LGHKELGSLPLDKVMPLMMASPPYIKDLGWQIMSFS